LEPELEPLDPDDEPEPEDRELLPERRLELPLPEEEPDDRELEPDEEPDEEPEEEPEEEPLKLESLLNSDCKLEDELGVEIAGTGRAGISSDSIGGGPCDFLCFFSWPAI